MRIVSWNCEGGFERKAKWLFELNPDIAVVQECSEIAARASAPEGFTSLWFGLPRSKGLAVFHRKSISLQPLAPPKQRWIVAFEVRALERFRLVAVWSCPERSGLKAYVRECRDAVLENPEWFQDGETVMTGDFNSNCNWDKSTGGQHRMLVKELSSLGLRSIYHARSGEEFGKESIPTIHHQRNIEKPFHIDFAFVSEQFLSRSTHAIGSPDIWLAQKRSDHCPITIDIDLH